MGRHSLICVEIGCAQATGGKGFILCLCGAIPAPLLCGNLPCHCPSNRAEHLLIHRIQSHTNPRRRKGFLKQAGQKSFKEELPKQRKGPKRAVKCRLKVQTHIWDARCREFESPHSDQLRLLKKMQPLKPLLRQGFQPFQRTKSSTRRDGDAKGHFRDVG